MPRKTPSTALVVSSEKLKKHAAAIHTSGELSLIGRKMVNVLLLNAYDALLTRRTHKLPVVHLRSMLGWDDSNNVDALKATLRHLASTPVEFNVMEDGKETWRVMSMISFGEIKDGVCTYRYDEYLAERLYDPEVYATINIGIQRRFDGGYALALYENCSRYRDVGSTGWWDLDRFRKIVGANSSMYDEFKYLKREVIVKPVEEINRVSDIRLVPEYRKNGRKVAAIRFLISESPQQTLLKPDVMDDYAELRDTDTFKRLREHGIGERLAIAWILEDEDRAKAIIAYVEEKDRKKQVKGTTAGYIRKLIENPDAEVGSKPAYETGKDALAAEAEAKAREQQQAARRAELEQAYRKQVVNARLRALTKDERHAYVLRYSEAEGQGKTASYDQDSGEFRNTIERIGFETWLRPQLSPGTDTKEFAAWLKANGKKSKGEGA